MYRWPRRAVCCAGVTLERLVVLAACASGVIGRYCGGESAWRGWGSGAGGHGVGWWLVWGGISACVAFILVAAVAAVCLWVVVVGGGDGVVAGALACYGAFACGV